MAGEVFGWRGTCHDEIPFFPSLFNGTCYWCGSPCMHEDLDAPFYGNDGKSVHQRYQCLVCGWYYHHKEWLTRGTRERKTQFEWPGLVEFDSVEDLPLKEFAAFLSRHYEEIYDISPRAFERRTQEFLRHHGLHAILTQVSHDSGADVVVLDECRSQPALIIECKRYAAHRKVGVEIVRALPGAMLDWGVSQAFIVTSSSFSSFACAYAEKMRRWGFHIDLVGATELLKLFGAYNAPVARLDELTPALRMEIALSNGAKRRTDS